MTRDSSRAKVSTVSARSKSLSTFKSLVISLEIAQWSHCNRISINVVLSLALNLVSSNQNVVQKKKRSCWASSTRRH